MQILADVTGYPVHTYREDVEAALGAGLLAGQAVGLINLTEANRHGHLEQRAIPDVQAVRHYDELFALYCQLYPTLKPLMHRLNSSGSLSFAEE